MRRTLLLLALVVLGGVLVAVVRPPARRTGIETVRGHRVFGGDAGVQGIEAQWGDQHVVALRTDTGWVVDGAPASVQTAAALQDLADELVRLRALDVFRARDAASYGLDRPRGTIVVTGGRRARRLTIGGLNAAGSAFYARREGDARVLQVGLALGSAVERVLYQRDRQRPEIG